MSESVEEFLRRGGQIKEVPFGVSGEKEYLKRHPTDTTRYVPHGRKFVPFNPSPIERARR